MRDHMYILLAKRNSKDKAEIVAATPSLPRGEELTKEVFSRNSIKSASLVYLSDGIREERLSVVYKLEVICDHNNIQGQFNFDEPGFPFFACESCSRVIRKNESPLQLSLKETEKIGAF